jgi:hypothetical protein
VRFVSWTSDWGKKNSALGYHNIFSTFLESHEITTKQRTKQRKATANNNYVESPESRSLGNSRWNKFFIWVLNGQLLSNPMRSGSQPKDERGKKKRQLRTLPNNVESTEFRFLGKSRLTTTTSCSTCAREQSSTAWSRIVRSTAYTRKVERACDVGWRDVPWRRPIWTWTHSACTLPQGCDGPIRNLPVRA